MNLPLPGNFEDALKISQQALGTSQKIVARGSLESEAEQLVIAAYRKAKARAKTFGRNDLYMSILQPYPREAGEVLVDYLKRRVSGEPLQYVLGYQTFLYHEYIVDPSVLIPRPETESLVFEVVQTFKRSIIQPELGFELGLGTGCISIELIKMFPELKMIGTEVSAKAAEVAKKNADHILGSEERLKILRVEEREIFPKALLKSYPNAFDFIVSNPPYLTEQNEMDDDVWGSEPHVALLAPDGDPLYYYRMILEEAFYFLKTNGVIFFEIPHERSNELHALASQWGSPEILPDLAGRDRILKLRRTLNG